MPINFARNRSPPNHTKATGDAQDRKYRTELAERSPYPSLWAGQLSCQILDKSLPYPHISSHSPQQRTVRGIASGGHVDSRDTSQTQLSASDFPGSTSVVHSSGGWLRQALVRHRPHQRTVPPKGLPHRTEASGRSTCLLPPPLHIPRGVASPPLASFRGGDGGPRGHALFTPLPTSSQSRPNSTGNIQRRCHHPPSRSPTLSPPPRHLPTHLPTHPPCPSVPPSMILIVSVGCVRPLARQQAAAVAASKQSAGVPATPDARSRRAGERVRC